jgi:hypothetical protein
MTRTAYASGKVKVVIDTLERKIKINRNMLIYFEKENAVQMHREIAMSSLSHVHCTQ